MCLGKCALFEVVNELRSLMLIEIGNLECNQIPPNHSPDRILYRLDRSVSNVRTDTVVSGNQYFSGVYMKANNVKRDDPFVCLSNLIKRSYIDKIMEGGV